MSQQIALVDTTSWTVPCENPATGEPLPAVPAHSPAQVRETIAKARAAQTLWAAAPLRRRKQVLRTIMDIVLRDADKLVTELVRDAGKTRENALLGEVWPVCEKIRATIAHADRALRPQPVSSGLFVHKRARVHFEPLGVIGVICPWNYPLQNVLGPVIPALTAGNAVVAKVSEWTAASAPAIAAIFDEALDAHGFSRDLVQVIVGDGATGEALIRGGVDKIIFTGSMPNGKKVLAASADTLTPSILELGGKDALIVCDDAHLEQAVHAALAGAFITAGQSCLAAERIIVFDEIYDRFVERVVEVAKDLRQGPPERGTTDVGAMTTPLQLARVTELVEDAVQKGAKVLVGGHPRTDLPGHFFAPTVLADVTPAMRIAQEETFGPVLAIMRVSGEEAAIELTNDTPYGLGCTVMTKDRQRADRIASRVRVGNVCVNDFGFTYMAQELPFGGVGGSGFGRLNGVEGLRACCNVKSVLSDRLPLHMPAKLFPVKDTTYELAKGAIGVVYGRGVGSKLRAVKNVAARLLKAAY